MTGLDSHWSTDPIAEIEIVASPEGRRFDLRSLSLLLSKKKVHSIGRFISLGLRQRCHALYSR